MRVSVENKIAGAIDDTTQSNHTASQTQALNPLEHRHCTANRGGVADLAPRASKVPCEAVPMGGEERLVCRHDAQARSQRRLKARSGRFDSGQRLDDDLRVASPNRIRCDDEKLSRHAPGDVL